MYVSCSFFIMSDRPISRLLLMDTFIKAQIGGGPIPGKTGESLGMLSHRNSSPHSTLLLLAFCWWAFARI